MKRCCVVQHGTKMPKAKPVQQAQDTPWTSGDPAKKVSLNIPLPEPLHMQLDYLVQHNAIRSKSSFIRDAVAAACTEEIAKLWRVREAVRRMEEGN